MVLKNKEGNKKEICCKFSSSDFRFEISAKNCIRITLGPEAVFFSQELTPKAVLWMHNDTEKNQLTKKSSLDFQILNIT